MLLDRYVILGRVPYALSAMVCTLMFFPVQSSSRLLPFISKVYYVRAIILGGIEGGVY